MREGERARMRRMASIGPRLGMQKRCERKSLFKKLLRGSAKKGAKIGARFAWFIFCFSSLWLASTGRFAGSAPTPPVFKSHVGQSAPVTSPFVWAPLQKNL